MHYGKNALLAKAVREAGIKGVMKKESRTKRRNQGKGYADPEKDWAHWEVTHFL